MPIKTLFTAHASSKGGRNGHSQTADGRLSFDLASPGSPTKKAGVVTNPEELFACGYSACFGSALEYVAGQQKISVEGAEVQAEVNLNQSESGFSISVVLKVSIPHLERITIEKLLLDAHHVCPYSKATRNNIDVRLEVAE